MSVAFCEGYAREPFATLCRELPDCYPGDAFRVEWGPVFHRGRLDGSARVLVIGQDPAQHEAIARRVLVGEAGHRVQGFLAKLGVEHSYAIVNTFLYSVFGQDNGERHADDPAIAAYRNRWLDAIFAEASIDAVIALGRLAERAFDAWKATTALSPAFVHITHPTQPESAAGNDPVKHRQLIAAMLRNWNAGLDAIAPAVAHPDAPRALVHYGEAFAAGEQPPIPLADLPAGTPPWMASDDGWADRPGKGIVKRATIRVTVPDHALP
jgi:uracil-DNA glycosylase